MRPPFGHNVSEPKLFTCLEWVFTLSCMVGCAQTPKGQLCLNRLDYSRMENSRYDPTANDLYMKLKMPMIKHACLKLCGLVVGTLKSINNFVCWVESGIVSFSEQFFIT